MPSHDMTTLLTNVTPQLVKLDNETFQQLLSSDARFALIMQDLAKDESFRQQFDEFNSLIEHHRAPKGARTRDRTHNGIVRRIIMRLKGHARNLRHKALQLIQSQSAHEATLAQVAARQVNSDDFNLSETIREISQNALNTNINKTHYLCRILSLVSLQLIYCSVSL